MKNKILLKRNYSRPLGRRPGMDAGIQTSRMKGFASCRLDPGIHAGTTPRGGVVTLKQSWLKFFSLAFILLICLTGCNKSSDLVDSQGKPLNLSDYHGKWLVINYWATWCKPCVVELPELNALYTAHTDKLLVLGVNFDHLSSAEIQQFAIPLQLKFPLLSQFPGEKYGIHDIPTLPITFVISPDGKLAHTLHGPQTATSLANLMELK